MVRLRGCVVPHYRAVVAVVARLPGHIAVMRGLGPVELGALLRERDGQGRSLRAAAWNRKGDPKAAREGAGEA